MERTVEQLFKNSFYVGNHYARFKILVVVEAINSETLKDSFQNHWIISVFNEAAEELGINLGDNDRTEFFAYYAYYWWNRNYFRREVDGAEALNNVIDKLGARLILSTGGVGDERFKNEESLEHPDFTRPIFIEAWKRREDLKEIFKAYLRICHSELDAAVEDIADRIAEGLSPLEAFDDVCDTGGEEFNTYPMGTPTNKFYPELLTICEEPHTFEKILSYIYKWLYKTDRFFPQRKVVLFTDKWIPETLSRYQKNFRRFTRRGVTFDIRLTTDRGAVKIPVF